MSWFDKSFFIGLFGLHIINRKFSELFVTNDCANNGRV